MIVKILMALRLKSRNALFESEHRSEHPHLACVRGSGGGVVPYWTASRARVSVHLSREQQRNDHLMARVTPRRKATARASGRTPARYRAAVVGSPSQDQDAGLERLKDLEEKLARTPASSHQRIKLIGAIRTEASAYRKSLDAEQAKAAHGAEPGPAAAPRQGRRRAIPLRARSAPRG